MNVYLNLFEIPVELVIEIYYLQVKFKLLNVSIVVVGYLQKFAIFIH